MNLPTRGALLVAALSLVACGLQRKPVEVTVRAVPFQAVAVSLPTGGDSVDGATIQAKVGAAPATFRGVEARTLAVVVPDVSPATYDVELSAGSDRLVLHLVVGSRVAVADPAGYLQQVAADLEVALTDLGSIAPPADAAKAAALASDLTALRARLAEARSALAAAGSEDLAAAAGVLAANEQALLPSGATGAAGPGGRTMARVQAFLAGRAVCVGVSPTPEAALDCIEQRVVTRVAWLLATVLVLGPTSGPLAAVAAGVQLLSMHAWLEAELSEGLVQTGPLLFDTASTQRAAPLLAIATGAPASSVAVATAGRYSATTTVRYGQQVSLPIRSTYRRVVSGDTTSGWPVLRSLATGVVRFTFAWQRLLALLPDALQATPYALPAADAGSTRPVTIEHLALRVPSFPGATLRATVNWDTLVLLAEAADEQERTLPVEIDYAGPASASTTVLEIVARPSNCDAVGTWTITKSVNCLSIGWPYTSLTYSVTIDAEAARNGGSVPVTVTEAGPGGSVSGAGTITFLAGECMLFFYRAPDVCIADASMRVVLRGGEQSCYSPYWVNDGSLTRCECLDDSPCIIGR